MGDGTFGWVVKAMRLKDQTYFAIKIIRSIPKYIRSAKIEADILKDIQRAQDLFPDRIYETVWLFETFSFKSAVKGDTKEYYCLVFEPLGKSLYQYIERNKFRGFDVLSIKHIAYQIFSALTFLHQMNLTHTDMKPENILMYNNVVKLCDFGLAR